MSSSTRRTPPGRAGRARDRRGRGARGPLAWPPVPAMRSRSQRFDDLVLDAVEDVEDLLHRRIDPVEIAVEDVPPPVEASWAEGVPLARYLPGHAGRPARIVVYRRPVESRAEDEAMLGGLVYDVVAEHVALALGLDPDELR